MALRIADTVHVTAALRGQAARDLRRFARDAGPLMLALTLLNGSNYGFNVVVSRLLGPASYGRLASILAVLLVMSVPFGVVQALVAKRAAGLGATDDTSVLAAGVFKALLPLAVASGAAVTAASPLLASFLKAGRGEVALLGAYAALAMLSAGQLGILQGRLRFMAFAAATAVGVIARLVVGIGLVAAGLGVTGALLGTVVASGVTVLLGFFLVNVPRSTWARTPPTLGPFRHETLAAVLSLGSFWLLGELDIILARHYLPGAASGIYSSAGLVSRALLFLPSALTVAALPRFAASHDRPEEGWRWLITALRLLLGLVVAGYLILISLRWLVVGAAFGARFRSAAELLPLLAAGSAVLAVISLLVYFHVAFKTRAYLFVFAGVTVEAVAVACFHRSGYQIGAGFLCSCLLVAVLQLHAARAITRYPVAGPVSSFETVAAVDAPEGGHLTLSIVLPCHNAGAGVGRVIEALRGHLADGPPYEIIVVSDGSTDGTVATATSALGGRMRVIHYRERAGKGHALRVGFGQARGTYVAFIDADGDIDPGSLRPLVELMDRFAPDIVLASKRHPRSEVHYPPLRRLLSWGYHRLGRLLFRIDVGDTQTGLKLFHRDVLEVVLPRMLEKRFAFDLELLVVARRHGFDRVLEAPVKIDYSFSSTIRPGAALRIFTDTLAIFYRCYFLDTYRPDGGRVRRSDDGDAVGARNPRRLRILFVNWRDIRHPDAGGAETWTHEVARRWVTAGHQVSLLTSGFKGAKAVETIDGVRVRRRGRLRNGSFHLLAQRELARLRGVDVVVDEINTLPFFTPLSRPARLVVALVHQTAREVWSEELPRPLAAFGRWVEPKLLRLYRDVPVVTVSESTRDDLVGIGLEHVHVIHGGRDSPPPSARALPKESVPTFLFVGRLERNKRPDHALEAFRSIADILPEARLWIIGRGRLEEKLRRNLPPGAEMLGYVSRTHLYEYMARAHCLLVPSVREGWGLVVIEANSVGTPAVGYDVAGIRDSIRHGSTGLLVKPGRPGRLAEEAVRLVANPRLYDCLRTSALEWSCRFSWDSTAEQLLEWLKELEQDLDRQDCAPKWLLGRTAERIGGDAVKA